MLFFILARFFSVGATAQEPEPPCWHEEPGYYWARVQNPAANFTVLAEPKRMSEVCAAGVVVANGTFFAPGAPLGDVIVGGASPYPLAKDQRRLKRGSRLVDLGKRWGIGVLKAVPLMGMADGDTALRTMSVYLGGGGLLLSDGQDVSPLNASRSGEWGPSFPLDILDDERGRTAVGIKDENGRQALLIVSTKDSAHATVSALADIMKNLGATEAVFYDGGGARGYAAGGKCLALPTNKGEDLNPTHIAIRACR